LSPDGKEEDPAMTRYAMLSDEPERLRRAYGTSDGWSVTPFTSAVGALVWERRLRSEGVIVLDSRGWRYGVVFTREANGDRRVATAPATSGHHQP
jgi:hypothetical protein